jgi:cysteine desulfurase
VYFLLFFLNQFWGQKKRFRNDSYQINGAVALLASSLLLGGGLLGDGLLLALLGSSFNSRHRGGFRYIARATIVEVKYKMIQYRYLDNNATTPVPDQILQAMCRWCNSGNASCTHPLALECMETVIEGVKRKILSVVDARGQHDCVLTSGGSEANADVILGMVLASPRPLTIISSRAEHSSVLDQLSRLESLGKAKVYWADLTPTAAVDTAHLTRLIREKPVDLVILQHANSELGAINNISVVAEILSIYRPLAFIHVDAVQTFTKEPIKIQPNMSIAASAHKFHGPMGFGFYVKPKNMRVFPLIAGKQNDGLRGGTFNNPGAAGTLAAIELVDGKPMLDPLATIVDYFRGRIPLYFAAGSPCSPGIAVLSGPRKGPNRRLINTVAIALIRESNGFVCGKTLKKRLECEHNVIVANGSACQSGKPSPLMSALEINDSFKKGMIRISTSRLTMLADLKQLCFGLASIYSTPDPV